jgi:uncharacterized lipoprotein
MRFDRIVVIVAVAASMSGCHRLLAKFEPNCHKPQEYQSAREVPPMTVPEGLDKPNTSGALVIPTVELAPPPPGPKDPCLEVPPRYQPAPSNKAGSSS